MAALHYMVALYILQHHAYNHYCLGETMDAEDLPAFEDWCRQRRDDIPQFRYWATVLELELLVDTSAPEGHGRTRYQTPRRSQEIQ